MSAQTFNLTDSEETLLTPYASLLGKSVSDLVVEQGKFTAIQNGLRHFANVASSQGAVDKKILAAVSKDSGAIFNAIWNDWNGPQALVPLVAAGLTNVQVAAA